jgi:hypothetical protein
MPQDPIRVTNFAWDSQNFPCDAVKAVVGLFGAENTIRHEVEQADAIKQAAATMTATLDSVFANLNNQVASIVPPDLVRVNAWLHGAQGDQRLGLYFGIRSPLPDPGPRATITGSLRFVALQASPEAVNCRALPITVVRKTGPRPVLNINGTLGDPPVEPLSINAQCDVAPGQSRVLPYRVSGLSSVFPNYFTFTSLQGRCTSGQSERFGLMFMPIDWPAEGVLSSTLSRRFDIQVMGVEVPCPPEGVVSDRVPIDDIGPVVNPDPRTVVTRQDPLSDLVRPDLGSRGVPGVRVRSGFGQSAGAPAVRFRGDGTPQSLNPQPLPPEPPPEIQRDRLRIQQDLIRLQQEQIRLQQEQLRLQAGQFR